jgi:hypothetical protein
MKTTSWAYLSQMTPINTRSRVKKTFDHKMKWDFFMEILVIIGGFQRQLRQITRKIAIIVAALSHTNA